MNEPSVQVPVSLIEDLRAALGFHVGEQDRLYRQVDALLSQSTPSAEHEPDCFIHHRGVSEKVCTCHPVPRIEDMAPGTTFVDSEGERWTIRQDRDGDPWANSDSGDAWDLDDVDPSTIRDVTPPAGA